MSDRTHVYVEGALKTNVYKDGDKSRTSLNIVQRSSLPPFPHPAETADIPCRSNQPSLRAD